MKWMINLFMLLFVLASCSSTSEEDRELEEREHDDIEREYVVTDASSNSRPGWIEDAGIWAKQNGKNTTGYRYFSYETDPMVKRSLSCDIAKAKAKTDIAGEITTFIDQSLGMSEEGQSSIDENNPRMQEIREFVENTLAQKVQALIHGAAIEKTYWEKRNYRKELGAKKDFKAYTCAVFVRMPVSQLKMAIDEAANHVIKQADDPETKNNVKRALNNASENYIKAKSGQI